ncbi:MAG: glycosyl hydrolase family 65 protein [Rhodothalassiaceae bacterium]
MKRRATESDIGRHGDDVWSILETGFDPARLAVSQSLFTVGDGFLGVRGGYEEELADGTGGAETWLNGVFEHVPIRYHEKAHGFPEIGDRRPRAPEATGLVIRIDGQRFAIDAGKLLDMTRRLDFRTGRLERRLVWQAPNGRTVRIETMRMASLARPGLLLQSLAIESGDDAAIEVEAGLRMPKAPPAKADAAHDPRIAPVTDESPWQEPLCAALDDLLSLSVRTRRSGVCVALAMIAEPLFAASVTVECGRDHAGIRLAGKGRLGLRSLTAHASDFGQEGRDAGAEALALAQAARETGFAALLAEQAEALAAYWRRAEVTLVGDVHLTQALRFNMFQILQASGRGGHLSLCAKGQSGEGYEGHYFWDAEIFGLPLLAFTDPARARDLLLFRVRTLEQARENARVLGHEKGALIAWRTIGGRESSAYFPAGSAQYHINADIAYALRLYVDATGDRDFLFESGAELLFETARIWLDLGHFNPRRDGAFTIHGVTGPDEYTAIVDNNFYTNAMAAAHLEFAARTAAEMARDRPEAWRRLTARIALAPDEPESWRAAAAAMYLPHDDRLGIHAQDDSFLSKPRWNIEETPEDRFPLLLHYHPLVLYRHQVAKQADTVLAHVLLGDRFEKETMARSLAYYESVTVHDSTLSAATFGIASSMAGESAKAFAWFRDAALVDLADLHGNSGHGLHMASMGGSWMCVAMGFLGMRLHAGRLAFAPSLPPGLESLSLRLLYRSSLIAISHRPERTDYRLLEGEPAALVHQGVPFLLGKGGVVFDADARMAANPGKGGQA